MKRREVIKNVVLGTGAAAIGTLSVKAMANKDNTEMEGNPLKGNVNHSACYWCYSGMPLEDFARKSAKIGLKAIDLLKPEEWVIAKKHGLTCSLATDTFASITDGFNDPKNHEALQAQYSQLITKASKAGIKQVIVFSGNRNGLDDTIAIENCVIGLHDLVKQAEKENVILVMELLNSKVDHPDYQCDTTPWGVALAEKIGSPNFKLLYDIYHMQIMEGDIIATIKKYHNYISHYHTGGVPGRNEINDSQELNYPAIIKAILDTGYKGYVAQEFVPTYEDIISALKEGLQICDV